MSGLFDLPKGECVHCGRIVQQLHIRLATGDRSERVGYCSMACRTEALQEKIRREVPDGPE